MSVPTIASWTRRGRYTILNEPRPVEVLHDGQWYRGDLTATRHEPDTGWWGFARYVVGPVRCNGSESTRASYGGRLLGRMHAEKSGRWARHCCTYVARRPSRLTKRAADLRLCKWAQQGSNL